MDFIQASVWWLESMMLWFTTSLINISLYRSSHILRQPSSQVIYTMLVERARNQDLLRTDASLNYAHWARDTDPCTYMVQNAIVYQAALQQFAVACQVITLVHSEENVLRLSDTQKWFASYVMGDAFQFLDTVIRHVKFFVPFVSCIEVPEL